MPGFDVRQPFTVAEAAAAGIPTSALRTRRFQRVLYGCYVAAGVELTERLMVRAAAKVVPDAYGASHESAARLLSGTVPHSPMVHLAVPEGRRCSMRGVRTHRYLHPPRMVRRRGTWMTDPTQTFLDMAPLLPLVDLVVLGDSLARSTGVEPVALAEAAAGARGRGARAAREAAAYVREGVDSAMETRARMLLVLAGLPEPDVNFTLRDRDGLVLRRVDLALPDIRLAIEYDGRQHVERARQWSSDLLRREEFEARGWRFIVLVSDDIYVHPDRTLHRVAQALRDRGVSLPPADATWRRHFPVRR